MKCGGSEFIGAAAGLTVPWEISTSTFVGGVPAVQTKQRR